MKISTNTIKQIADIIPNDINQLVDTIGQQLGAVEEVVDFGRPLQDVIVVNVVSCEKHPNADRLSLCKVDDGQLNQDVERDENGYVQIVCGAPNVREGMLAAWLPPSSVVPSTYGKDEFTLEARELRGYKSNGMLASAQELGLGTGHDGILEVDNDCQPGTLFNTAYDLENDHIIDIENKMFTHRPDCFGVLGVAREIAGIQKKSFTSPNWYNINPQINEPEATTLPINVDNRIPELVKRFTVVTMKNIKVQQSPVWLQIALAKLGANSINNVVDLTNYFMLLTGQPLHAYDYDKVKGNADIATLIIRKPEHEESIALLNGKTVQPRADAIMIATPEKSIGIGGVMGGTETEVDDSTTNIIIEAANFDMYNIRKTSMVHGLFTDAVTRFNKGQSPHQTKTVLAKIVSDLERLAKGTVASEVVDDCNVEIQHYHQPIHVSTDFINARLGLQLSAEEMKQLLNNVEFQVEVDDQNLQIAAPFWRTDIEIGEDVVEEVGRLNGFANMPQVLPPVTMKPVAPDSKLSTKSLLRSNLAKLGANEVLTYSFVHQKLLEQTGQNKDLAFKITNALSPALQYYRMSLTPSILANVHANIKAGHDEFALFELGKTHNKLHSDDDNGVPKEYEMLSLVYAAKQDSAQPAFYQARYFIETLARMIGISLSFKSIDTQADMPVTQPFDVERSALVCSQDGSSVLGIVGEYRSEVTKALKLPQACAGFEIGTNELMALQTTNSAYHPLSKFPSISQDICLQVQNDTEYGPFTRQFENTLTALVSEQQSVSVNPIDIYTSDELANQKRITYRVNLNDYRQTLTDTVLTTLLDKTVEQIATDFSVTKI